MELLQKHISENVHLIHLSISSGSGMYFFRLAFHFSPKIVISQSSLITWATLHFNVLKH